MARSVGLALQPGALFERNADMTQLRLPYDLLNAGILRTTLNADAFNPLRIRPDCFRHRIDAIDHRHGNFLELLVRMFHEY